MVSQEDIKEFILTHKKKLILAVIVLILLIILIVYLTLIKHIHEFIKITNFFTTIKK